MRKRFLALALVCVLLLGLAVPVSAEVTSESSLFSVGDGVERSYERDASGKIEKTTITAGNGDAFLEHTYDSKRVFGLCTQADVTETQYGTLEYADGVFYVDPYTPTREVQYVVKYRH